MKLLLDQNLSPRLLTSLGAIFPGSIHVRDAGLSSADDQAIWDFAAQHGFTIVSKDTDFRQRSFVFGHPPKVIGIRLGNCSTAEIESLIRTHNVAILTFGSDEAASFLAIP